MKRILTVFPQAAEKGHATVRDGRFQLPARQSVDLNKEEPWFLTSALRG